MLFPCRVYKDGSFGDGRVQTAHKTSSQSPRWLELTLSLWATV